MVYNLGSFGKGIGRPHYCDVTWGNVLEDSDIELSFGANVIQISDIVMSHVVQL